MIEFFNMLITWQGFLFIILMNIMIAAGAYIIFRAIFAAYYRSRSNHIERLHRIYLQLTGKRQLPPSPSVTQTNNTNREDN